ncbi:MAG: hypothetical protein N2654_05155, partial [Deltaproteobacteria bacterium]|nr:hypothetical protein [Deltaproteobacteria bacterium]
MARWIFTIYLVLCLSCALNRDSSETNQKLFPAWVPFKFGISYDGSKLPNFVIDGDESMLKGKYEQAYIQYVSYTVPSNLREDVYHRLAVSLILMKQPIRAYELTQRLKARQYFNNSNGALIRIKALLDAGFFEKAFFEAEKLLNNKPSMTISSKLRIMIMEKIQLVSPAKSLISNEARFPRLNELIDGFQSKVDQSRVEKTASTIEAQQRLSLIHI